MSKKVTLTCEACGVEFQRFPSLVKDHNYCSKECHYGGAARNRRDPVEIIGDIALISLTKGQVTAIDKIDYETLPELENSWMAQKSGETFYAWKWIDRVYTYMHVYIMKPEAGKEVHHNDDNGLNNRRYNLKVLSHSEHKATRERTTPWGTPASKYRGVIFERKSSKNPWVAQIRVRGQKIYLGCFSTEEAAAREFDQAALAAFGNLIHLNFPEEHEDQNNV